MVQYTGEVGGWVSGCCGAGIIVVQGEVEPKVVCI